MRPASVPGPIWRTTRTNAVRAATMTSACPPRRSIRLTARSKPPPARDLVARSGVLSHALDGSFLSVPRQAHLGQSRRRPFVVFEDRCQSRAIAADEHGQDGRDRFGRAEGEFPDGGVNTVAGRRRLSRARQLRQRRGGDADREEIAPFHVAYSYPG